jgi:hypothetical protein
VLDAYDALGRGGAAGRLVVDVSSDIDPPD